MKILRNLVIICAATAALAVAVGYLLPQTAHVERSIVVEAPQATVFTVLNGFRQFDRWSPWADIDPNASSSYAGPGTGVGSKMSWSGNAEVGSGSQEILESTPYSSIKLRLVFGDFGGAFGSSYTVTPEGTGTKVTWAFDADYGSSIFGRYFGPMSDTMLGPDYEKGLGRLKQFVESLPKADFSGMQFERVASAGVPVVLLATRSANDANAIGVVLGVAYGQLSGYLAANGLTQSGPPVAIYLSEDDSELSIDAGIPVEQANVAPAAPIRVGRTFEGIAVKATYRGDYSGLPAAREQVRAYLAAAGLEQAGPPWEQFVSDPGSTPVADLVTNIFVPIR